MQQKLVLCLLLHGVILQDPPHIRQKQHRHIESVVPQFLFVDAVGGLVLKPSLPGPGERIHNFPGRRHAGLQVLFLPGVLRQKGHGQIGGRSIDIQRRKAYPNLPVIVLFQRVQITFFLFIAKQLPQPKQAYALGPLPEPVLGDIISGQIMVRHVFQENIILLVQNVGKGFHHPINLVVNPLYQFFLFSTLFLQLSYKRLKLLWGLYRVIRLPVRLLYAVEISG